MTMERISVIGAGSWGTALSVILASKGLPVTLYARNDIKASYLRAFRENKTYLPGVRLPSTIEVTSDWEAICTKEVHVLAVPSHVVSETVERIRADAPGSQRLLIVNTAKGFEGKTNDRISTAVRPLLKEPDRYALLSGPSHAEEVGRFLPAAVTVASESEETAAIVQELFMAESFRVYTNSDLAGVEIAGATKNVIAIAAGINAGLGFGDNSAAALVTRGLAEITRLGTAMGARAETFFGLAGLGDLMVTCNSEHSRNRRCGFALGRGESLDAVLDRMGMVVEGVRATGITRALARRHGVEMPIVEEVAQVLFEGKDPRESVLDLMLRQKKEE